MSDNHFNPYIHVSKEKVEIIGDCDSLIRLGEALILKGKLGKSISMTLTDDVKNTPIHVLCDLDILEKEKGKNAIKKMMGLSKDK